MKALVLTDYNRLEYRDVDEPAPAPEEVLVGVRACGICGSDVHGVDGSTGRRRPPLIMGHEAAGVVAAVGEAVRNWKVGERVTFDSTVYCGRCLFCRAGEINLCNARRVLGVACEEFRCAGAFAELVAVPQHILYRLPEGLAFEEAAMVEPVSIAVHAVGRLGIGLGETAAVVGAGMIGLMAVQALRAAGCGTIVAVDPDPSRLELARELGADTVLGAGPEAPQTIREATGGQGADVAVEAVGLAEAVGTAIGSVRKGGRVALVGNLSAEVPLPLQAVVTRELAILGSCASQGEYPACLELIHRGAIRVRPLLSAVAPLAEGAEWFHRLHGGEAGLMKVVLTP